MYRVRYSCEILMELEFCRQIFEKYKNMEFYDSRFNGSRVVPFGQTEAQTDKYEEANRRFCNLVNAIKNSDCVL